MGESKPAWYELQGTFSEKGIKITPQTHIWKFEILHFLDNKSKAAMIQNFLCSEKCTTYIKLKEQDRKDFQS